jgi:hypothetical protein
LFRLSKFLCGYVSKVKSSDQNRISTLFSTASYKLFTFFWLPAFTFYGITVATLLLTASRCFSFLFHCIPPVKAGTAKTAKKIAKARKEYLHRPCSSCLFPRRYFAHPLRPLRLNKEIFITFFAFPLSFAFLCATFASSAVETKTRRLPLHNYPASIHFKTNLSCQFQQFQHLGQTSRTR